MITDADPGSQKKHLRSDPEHCYFHRASLALFIFQAVRENVGFLWVPVQYTPFSEREKNMQKIC
jgi:hypothetical protein